MQSNNDKCALCGREFEGFRRKWIVLEEKDCDPKVIEVCYGGCESNEHNAPVMAVPPNFIMRKDKFDIPKESSNVVPFRRRE